MFSLPEGYTAVMPDEQGFLTSEGVFVSRKHGMIIAKLAGQVPMDHGPDELFSEDLW